MKKVLLLLSLLASSFSIDVSASQGDQLLPIPVEYKATGEGTFLLNKEVSVTISNPSLARTAELLTDGIYKLASIKLSVKQSSKTKNCINLYVDASSPLLLQNHTTYGVSPIMAPLPSATNSVLPDERYTVNITKKGIEIIGASDEAVFRGCTTLLQMVGFAGGGLVPAHKQCSTNKKGNDIISGPALDRPLQSIVIKDAPTFAWRGLSLDISRCFISAEDIKTVIDIMALYKLNVLHLHLNDNQGWRIEVKGYPELTEKGGFVYNDGKEGGFLTQEQYKAIVKYASDRMITVVPELDLPGHSNAIFKAYPQVKNIAKLPFEFNLPGQAMACIDPDDEPTMKMVDEAIKQIAELTPGKYFHIGADETFGMQDDKYLKFVHHVRSLVHSLGKGVVGWQEMARAEVAPKDIVQNWIAFSKKQIAAQTNRKSSNTNASAIPQEVRDYLGKSYKKAPSDIPTAISKGAKILLSPQAYCYLDCPYEEESVDTAQKAERDRLGLRQYTRQNIRDMYEWNPLTFYKNLDFKKSIAGVEAAIWGESISSFKDMQFLLLPRLAGVAEKAWGASNNTSWDVYSSHIATQSVLWNKLNWNSFKSEIVDWK